MGIEDNIKTEITMLTVKKGWAKSKLAKELGKRLGKNYSASNLSNKLKLETIPYREIKLIADILGYDIEFVDRSKKQTPVK